MAKDEKDNSKTWSDVTIDMEEVDGVWQEGAPDHEGDGRRSNEDPDLRAIVITMAMNLAVFGVMAAWQVLGGRLFVGLVVLVTLSIVIYLFVLKTLELVVRIWNLWRNASALFDTVTVDATIINAQSDDLTVTLAHPEGGSVELGYLGSDQWQAADSTAFQGQALDQTWTLTIADADYNGITGTLTAWSITVTPLTEGALVPPQSAAATDLVLLARADMDSSDDDDADPLATQAADELALMLVE